MLKSLSVLVSAALLSTLSVAACDSPDHRAFDFWLGTWDVYSAQGQKAGSNTITKQLNSCVIKEDYETPTGYKGQSFNIYDRITDQWHQTWVDNTGLLLKLNGHFDGSAMVLAGSGKNQQGEPVTHRITWTLEQDKSVRQHWQASKDSGKTWATLFDGKYVKRIE